jgi:hypothetical protein
MRWSSLLSGLSCLVVGGSGDREEVEMEKTTLRQADSVVLGLDWQK